MLQILKTVVALFVSIEMLFASTINGITPKEIEMPEPVTGEYTQYVDPFIGTGGIPWTCGMLSPAASAPFGAVRLGPDTSFLGGIYITKLNTSGYYYEQNHILGFSHSRLSGTGAEEYGIFRITPAVGNRNAGTVAFSHDNEVAAPGYYAVYLKSLGCLAEMTADEHTGVHRYTFNHSKDARLSLDVTSAAANNSCDSGFAEYDEETGIITGGAVVYAQFSGRYDGLPCYFALKADKEIKECKIEGSETDLTVDINFGNLENESVEVKVGISFVSAENALLNLEEETGNLDFDGVVAKTVNNWESHLLKIDANSTDADVMTTFYTALYHTMIMPTDFTDVNGEYLGFDKETHTADGYTYRSDMSLWDTVRNTHSLYTLIEHEVQNDCLNSLVDMAAQGEGNLPRWPQGAGYASSMFGDSANIMIAESYIKGFTDFDVEAAYEFMKYSSENATDKAGREYVEAYNEYGYVPNDIDTSGKSVSRTLEYSWEDAAIAILATALGKTEDAEKYTEKSMYYKNVFNEDTKYFQPRNADGSYSNIIPNATSFYDDILGLGLTKGFCEGSARQWRWSATHDIEGMIDLFGSDEYFVSELEAFMEDAAPERAYIDPGSGYWVGNQHDIHTPYLFADAGRSDLTQKWVRWTLDNRFSTDTNGLDGNDDGGTLSAWYVFSAMGFYPLAGTDKYWIGSPNLDNAEITLDNGNTLKVTAINQGKDNIYVEKVTFNGVELDGVYITHAELMQGGELVFTMSSK